LQKPFNPVEVQSNIGCAFFYIIQSNLSEMLKAEAICYL